MKEQQMPIFYEDIYDAINRTISTNPQGLSIKQIAMTLWPTRNPDTARNVLSRAITQSYSDVRLNPEELDKTMEITDCPEHIIFYFCDKYGFERPSKKNRSYFEEDIKREVSQVASKLNSILQYLSSMEKIR